MVPSDPPLQLARGMQSSPLRSECEATAVAMAAATAEAVSRARAAAEKAAATQREVHWGLAIPMEEAAAGGGALATAATVVGSGGVLAVVETADLQEMAADSTAYTT